MGVSRGAFVNARSLGRHAAWVTVAAVTCGALAPTWASESLYFGEPGGAIEVAAATLPAETPRLTVECRIKSLVPGKKPLRLIGRWNDEPPAEGAGRNNAPKAAHPDKAGFYLGLGTPGEVVFTVRDAEGVSETISGHGLKQDANWHHLAATWDEGTVVLYIDGKEARRKVFTKVTALGRVKPPLVIGTPVAVDDTPPTPAPTPAGKDAKPKPKPKPVKSKEAKPAFFEGFVSDVAVWTNARDKDTITASLEKPLVGNEPGLVAFFPLHEKTTGPVVAGLPAVTGQFSGSLGMLGWWDVPAWTEPAPAVAKDAAAGKPLVPIDLTRPPQAVAGQKAVGPPLAANAPRFIVANDKTNQAGVVWQDPGSKKMFVTWVDKDLTTLRCAPLPTQEKADLLAVAWGPEGTLYYLMIEPKEIPHPELEPPKATLFRVHADGKPMNEAAVDMGRDAFNWWAGGGRCHMAYADGWLALHLVRTMCNGNPNGEGIHHQASVSAAYSEDLSTVRMLGNPSSHSFGSILAATSSRDVMGLELGDCFPRAMQLHKISGGDRKSKIIHNYKANLITITKDDKPLKVCHDANTYTELGGVVEGAQCYSVFFSTDGSPTIPVLDFDLAGKPGVPRNLAMLRVIKDFERVPSHYDVKDEMVVPAALPAAPVETGEFCNFTGELCRQRNAGLVWLTDYAEGEAAHAPHPIRRRDGSTLVIWEKTGSGKPGGAPAAPSLWAMTMLESGRSQSGPVLLGSNVSMDREEPIIRVGSRDFLLVSEGGKPRLLAILDP